MYRRCYDKDGGCCGVYVGISGTDFLIDHVKPMAMELNAFILPGNVLSVAAGRLSFVFGLKGPSMAVDTVWGGYLGYQPDTREEFQTKLLTLGDDDPEASNRVILYCCTIHHFFF